jgi:hypothetical protein
VNEEALAQWGLLRQRKKIGMDCIHFRIAEARETLDLNVSSFTRE